MDGIWREPIAQRAFGRRTDAGFPSPRGRGEGPCDVRETRQAEARPERGRGGISDETPPAPPPSPSAIASLRPLKEDTAYPRPRGVRRCVTFFSDAALPGGRRRRCRGGGTADPRSFVSTARLPGPRCGLRPCERIGTARPCTIGDRAPPPRALAQGLVTRRATARCRWMRAARTSARPGWSGCRPASSTPSRSGPAPTGGAVARRRLPRRRARSRSGRGPPARHGRGDVQWPARLAGRDRPRPRGPRADARPRGAAGALPGRRARWRPWSSSWSSGSCAPAPPGRSPNRRRWRGPTCTAASGGLVRGAPARELADRPVRRRARGEPRPAPRRLHRGGAPRTAGHPARRLMLEASAA